MNGIPLAIGSLPHTDEKEAVDFILNEFAPGVPFWPQLPKRSYLENFYVQYSEGLPGVVVDEQAGRIFLDTESSLEQVAVFYEKFEAGDWDHFAVTADHAAGLHELISRLKHARAPLVKGHVTGPMSFALSVPDQRDRLLAYHEDFFDIVVRGMTAKALWQFKALAPLADEVILFFDEPSLVGFGSAYVQVSREQVEAALAFAVHALHEAGAVVGIHCCANTDWSLILNAGVDILSFDAFSYFDHLTIYASELKLFFGRGGRLAFGIVPTDEKVFELDEQVLGDKLADQIRSLEKLGVDAEQAAGQSLISPACGLGTTDVALSQRALALTRATSEVFQDRYGL